MAAAHTLAWYYGWGPREWGGLTVAEYREHARLIGEALQADLKMERDKLDYLAQKIAVLVIKELAEAMDRGR